MAEHVTMVQPGMAADDERVTSGLPTDLVAQAADRLGTLALLYAFTFFFAGVFPALIFPGDRAMFFSHAMHWGPPVIALVVALVVAVMTRRRVLPPAGLMNVGLVFQVVSSYCIAAAELAGIQAFPEQGQLGGMSWVAVWTLLFTVVIPAPPRRAVVAALASVSAVPAIVGVVIATNGNLPYRPNGGQFFFWFVFPYLLVVVMAWVGARVVYGLGKEVVRARELGSYHLEEKLGEGGMGEVWRARHNLLARPAAIKLIRPGKALGGRAHEVLRRFEREAQVISGLRSPHTVGLYDFGVATDGSFYYVMELLDGLDADALVRRFGPLPAERAVYLVRQVCHSLIEADARRLVHRDIKPANIYLCRYGEELDFVKVLDFGIVAAAADEGARDAALTRDDAIQGTPAFMAPEQAVGQSRVDARADIYATGCVAYWLLTGQLVFQADNPIAMMVHHAQTPPAPPSTHAELPVPPALDAIVLACLAKNPAARPQSAAELARLLKEIPHDHPWSQERARAWWEAHLPGAVTAAASAR